MTEPGERPTTPASGLQPERLRAQHWDGVYERLGDTQVSWYEATPEFSLTMLDAVRADPAEPVIDVGAGASRLVDGLLKRGFTDVTALDIADDGLALSRARLGPDAARVRWIVADLLRWVPDRRYGVWHDRAVFHFLTDRADQARYRDLVDTALGPEGRLVIGAFAHDGPLRCSGLPTTRYSPSRLAAVLDPDRWTASVERRELHRTPAGTTQPLTWLALQRRR